MATGRAIERLEIRLLGVMLQKFSDEILECCQFADECRRNADKADDLSRKQFWLDMEKRWLQRALGRHRKTKMYE